MAGNTLLTNAEITYETAAVLMNSLVFAGKINREYSAQFWETGAQRGNQIHVRKPIRGIVGDGPTVKINDITETYATLTLNHQKNIGVNFTSVDRTLSIDNFRDRIIKPQVVEMANEIDLVVLQDVYSQIANSFGTAAVVPNDSAIFLDAGARLLNESTPDDDSWLNVITPKTQSTIVKALQGLYNSQELVGEQYRRGRMFQALGLEWYHDQNMPTHVTGALGGTPLVDGAAQTGASLKTKGWTHNVTGVVKKGDVFTIGSSGTSVFAVNPKSRQSYGDLRQFVVTEDANSDNSGNATLKIDPPITPPDSLGNRVAFQTTTKSPADGASINMFTTSATVSSPQNLLFHPDFATLGFADLVEPKVGQAYRVSDPDLNIAMRVWESSDWVHDMHGVRIDVLFGVCVIYPQWACRVWS